MKYYFPLEIQKLSFFRIVCVCGRREAQCKLNFNSVLIPQAERRLSPDFSRCDKALYCTTKTHRCLHATHAYTGIPCAAYSKLLTSFDC